LCDDYTLLSEDKLECIETVCKPREVVQKDGSCMKCEDYYIPNETKRECVNNHCEKNQKTEKDGTCTDTEPKAENNPIKDLKNSTSVENAVEETSDTT
jgi:hypothetical protein